MSTQILDHKMVHAQATKATTIVTANPGCLLQMKVGVEREGLSDTVQAVHIVDLLAEAVREAEKDIIVNIRSKREAADDATSPFKFLKDKKAYNSMMSSYSA